MEPAAHDAFHSCLAETVAKKGLFTQSAQVHRSEPAANDAFHSLLAEMLAKKGLFT